MFGFSQSQLKDRFDAEFIVYFKACEKELREVVDLQPSGQAFIVKKGKQHVFVCEENSEERDGADYIVSRIDRSKRYNIHYHAVD